MRFSKSFNVVGIHCEGEVGNVIVGGLGQIPGESMLDKRNFLAENRDWIRKMILSEPRGQVARNANIILHGNFVKTELFRDYHGLLKRETLKP